jgi:hypothetical protein
MADHREGGEDRASKLLDHKYIPLTKYITCSAGYFLLGKWIHRPRILTTHESFMDVQLVNRFFAPFLVEKSVELYGPEPSRYL